MLDVLFYQQPAHCNQQPKWKSVFELIGVNDKIKTRLSPPIGVTQKRFWNDA